jgi:hypothetical protein
LIEDVAMAWLAHRDGRPLGSWGDLSFFSPWKTYGLPDGGALLCRDAIPPSVPVRRDPAAAFLVRGLARGVAQRHGWVSGPRKHAAPSAEFDSDSAFSLPHPDNGPSATSVYLLRRAAVGDPAAVRRSNLIYMGQRLGSLVLPPYNRPRTDSCPFGVPIVVPDKQRLIARLLDRGISAVDFWAVPHPLLPVEDFPAAAGRRATTMLLPVHQELEPDHIEYICDTVHELTQGETP